MNTAKIILSALIGIFSISSCSKSAGNQALKEKKITTENIAVNDSTSIIYFAGGCFLGAEHFFKQINGVTATEVGFAYGHTDNPTYKDVINKKTDFAETVKVIYNPKILDLNLLVDLYFLTIDPAGLNKQVNDIGDRYWTGIYCTSEQQLLSINKRIKTDGVKHSRPIVVEVSALEKYYKAEDYYQDYLEKKPGSYHINPELFKVAKAANRKNDQ